MLSREEREVYVVIKISELTSSFSIDTKKSLREIRKFYSTYGVATLLLAESGVEGLMNGMTWIFLWEEMEDLVTNYKDIEVIVTTNEEVFKEKGGKEERKEEKEERKERKERKKDIKKEIEEFENMSRSEQAEHLWDSLKKLLNMLK